MHHLFLWWSVLGCSPTESDQVVIESPFGTAHGVPTQVDDYLVLEHDILVSSRRAALRTEPTSVWPDCIIPYSFDSGLSAISRANFEEAAARVEAKTSLVLVEDASASDRVVVTPGSGCWSFVGRVGGLQELVFNDTCTAGSGVHEIGHAAGMWHEHNRADRDDYIVVNWDNMESDSWDAYYTYVDNGFDGLDHQAYDFGSRMHYSSDTYMLPSLTCTSSDTSGCVMTKLDGSYIVEAQDDNFSDGDVQGLASVYDAECGCDDEDGDGFPVGHACATGPGLADCDDDDASVYPTAHEDCTDGKDNDCDGVVDGPPGTQIGFYSDGTIYTDTTWMRGNVYRAEEAQRLYSFRTEATAPSGTTLTWVVLESASGGGVWNVVAKETSAGSAAEWQQSPVLDVALDQGMTYLVAIHSSVAHTQNTAYLPAGTSVEEGLLPLGIGSDHELAGTNWTGEVNDAYLMAQELTLVPAENPDNDGDGAFLYCDDCDDDDQTNFPGNEETCDGVDNNCDGQADEGLQDCEDGVPGADDSGSLTSDTGGEKRGLCSALGGTGVTWVLLAVGAAVIRRR
jgi:hypothetical protein